MNVIDSSGWLEYFTNGTNAAFFVPVIEDFKKLIVPSISLYEVFKKVLKDQGEEKALFVTAQMKNGRVCNLDEETALSAAKLSLEYRLPMADSLILATARQYRAKLWTQDEHFKGIEGVRYRAKKRD